jgi:hypothetical protein
MLKVLLLNIIIVKQCFWIQIKFNTEDSKAIHTIITTISLKLNKVILLEITYNRRRSIKQAKLGLEIDSVLIKREV